MTPARILLKLGLHPSKIAKYVVSVKPALPDSDTFKSKTRLENLAKGLTVHGTERKIRNRISRDVMKIVREG